MGKPNPDNKSDFKPNPEHVRKLARAREILALIDDGQRAGREQGRRRSASDAERNAARADTKLPPIYNEPPKTTIEATQLAIRSSDLAHLKLFLATARRVSSLPS